MQVQNSLILDDDKQLVSTLLLKLLLILTDAIVSESSTQFIDDLKRRLNYELSLVVTLKTETHLGLSFDVSESHHC